MLSSLNKLTSGWGFTFNPDTMSGKKSILPLLKRANGFLNGFFTELTYDSGCTISYVGSIKPAFTIDGDQGELPALGLELPSGGKVAAFGNYWWLTFHGHAGFPAADNYKVVYAVLRWLAHLDLTSSLPPQSPRYWYDIKRIIKTIASGSPRLSLDEIARKVNVPVEKAEELLLELITSKKLIGHFDPKTKSFISNSPETQFK
nr:PCI domain-containing protein [Candidatus Sigynarchaeota archaeon]